MYKLNTQYLTIAYEESPLYNLRQCVLATAVSIRLKYSPAFSDPILFPVTRYIRH